MTDFVHPALLFVPGALLIPFLTGWVRKAYLLLVPALAIAAVAAMEPGTYGEGTFLGQAVVVARVDKLSIVFAAVFTIMALIGMVYALHLERAGQHVAAFVYVGSALGVVFAGDYLTLFLFWEGMAFASAYLVFAQGGAPAIGAGFRYLMVHITGGVVLLGGIVLYARATGSLLFGPVEGALGPAAYLILAGFMLNAAVPPLNAWLTDAYPEATVTGAVFMSAFTTKTAVYVLARGFPGTELLVWFGTAMAIYGVIYAVLENDCRRLLAYHIVSQVGYMVAGIGIGTELALNGATSHAFAHILYKALLFMGAGAVIYVTGRRKLTELGGLYAAMPLTVALYMVGAFAISAFPFFSGFVTKSMVVAAAGQDHRALVVLLLTMASSGTFLHTGLKLPYYMFFGKDAGPRGAGAAAQHADRDGPGGGALHRDRGVPRAALRPAPLSGRLRALYRAARDREPRHPDVHRARLRPVPQGARPREHHQPRHRLVLPQGRAGVHVARRGIRWRATRRRSATCRRPPRSPSSTRRREPGSCSTSAASTPSSTASPARSCAAAATLRRLQTGVVSDYAVAMIAGVMAAIAIFVVAWR